MRAAAYVAIVLLLTAGGCMAEGSRVERSGPAKVVATRSMT
jgi:hypothetical protein